jgi:hypothetical protein
VVSLVLRNVEGRGKAANGRSSRKICGATAWLVRTAKATWVLPAITFLFFRYRSLNHESNTRIISPSRGLEHAASRYSQDTSDDPTYDKAQLTWQSF